MDQVNSGSTKAQAIFDEAVLYPNPYMVVTRKGYTKHYYAGTERLATVIGGGGLNELTQAIVPADDPHDDEIKKAFDKPYLNYDPFRHQGTVGSLVPTEDISGKTSPELEYQCKPAELLMVEVLGDKDMLLAPIKEYGEVREEETKRYFYHGDHLGSANWITDVGGNPIQYIHYAPYGELIDNQQATQYDERYKFTGKERDWETGYDYFGARYWWLGGTWLSVDPLSDKYPQISPYAYCEWNPIKFVDPDGRKVGMSGAYRNEDGTTSIATFYYGEVDGVRGFYHNGQRLGNEFANKATDAIGKIHDGGKYGKMLVDAVVKDDRTINLNQVRKPKDNASKCALKALFWCVDDFKPGSEDVPSFITLSHEFGHFLTNWYNIADYGTWYDGVPNDEKLVVNFENLIRNENHLDTRKYYGFPSTPGGHGEGEIPQWDWVGNYLEIITNGL